MVHNFPKGLSPFYIRVYQIVDDPSLNSIISWGKSNNSFVMWNLPELHTNILKKSVELGGNIANFVTELSYYGFKRIKGPEAERWEYGHDYFVKGQPELLEKMSLKSWTKRYQRFGATLKPKKAIAKGKKTEEDVADCLKLLRIKPNKAIAKGKKANAEVANRLKLLRI